MTFSSILIVLNLLWQTVLPYKPNDEFQITLDYQFKQRVGSDNLTVDYEKNGQPKRTEVESPRPYLMINFKVVKLAGQESRVRVLNNKNKVGVNKKVEAGDTFKMDLGFTDDMKDRVSANEYTVTFLSADKQELSRVLLVVQEDGTFLVNDEKRGKF